MNKKMLSLLLTGAMAASMLAPATVVSASDNTEKVKLTYYGWSDEEEYLQPLFDAFNEQSETAYIEPQYCAVGEYEEVVLAALAAGTPIDVLAINGLSPMSNYQEKGLLMDMTEYAEAAGFDPAEVYQDTYSGANEDGMYGIPYRMAVWLMFYNRDLLDELGVEVQTDTSYTWDEFNEKCLEVEEKLKENGMDIESDPNNGCYAGLVGVNKNMTIAQRGVSLLDDDTSAIEEFWTLWNELQENGTHLPYAEKLEYGTNVGSVYWVTGRVAFFQNATWGISSYNTKVESGEMAFQYGVMPLPVPDGVEDNTNLSNPNFFGIPTTSEHPEEAYEFIQFACSHDGAMILADQGVLPAYSDDEVAQAYSDYANQPDDTLSRIISSENNRLTDLCFPGYAEVQAAYEEAMESYLVGNMTLEEALDSYVTKKASILGE
jgi:ABC-type glycerol-3-phosphate transport system substrate-binding protein